MIKTKQTIKNGDRVKWQYIHCLNSRSTIEIVKKGKYYGKIRHTYKHWEKDNAKQMACVHFEGNKNCSIVPFNELKKMKQVNWAGKAYKSTQVNWARTQAQVYKMLGELGIYEIRFTNLRDKFALEFLVQIKEGEKPRAVRIVVPVKYQGESDDEREKELNIIHRILFNHLKAKFVSVQTGLTEFEEEFMAHLLITDKHGNSTTIGEAMLPQYKKVIESGENKDFKLLPGPEEGN